MTTEPLPAIEPVTDEDVRVAVKAGEMVVAPFVQRALEQDRRRVAERQAARITDQPMSDYEIGHMEGAEMVVEAMGAEIERLRAEVAKLRAAQANMIDATGAVEGRVQKLPVPASGWAGGTSLEYVTIPREWAGSRVLIVMKP